MNILSNVSERLKDLMSEKDLNITELSAKTHIDRAVISRLLKAERMPSTATLVILADYFECTADYILGMTEHYDERTFKTRRSISSSIFF